MERPSQADKQQDWFRRLTRLYRFALLNDFDYERERRLEDALLTAFPAQCRSLRIVLERDSLGRATQTIPFTVGGVIEEGVKRLAQTEPDTALAAVMDALVTHLCFPPEALSKESEMLVRKALDPRMEFYGTNIAGRAQ